jgi:hypothetical protein
MTVKERTEGGYTKVETKNGTTRYHDPNGHPTNQQAFAASKGQEQRDQEITERGENGRIQDTEVTTEDDGDGEPIKVPAERITASFDADTDETKGGNVADRVEVDAEIGGLFAAAEAPTDDEIEDKIKELREYVATEMPFVRNANINIEKRDVIASVGSIRGWDSFVGDDVVGVEFESGWDEDYDVDVDQTTIPDWED